MLFGVLITGDVLSTGGSTLCISTVNELVAILPEISETLHVTVVIPIGNNVFGAGSHVTEPLIPRLSVAVGILNPISVKSR